MTLKPKSHTQLQKEFRQIVQTRLIPLVQDDLSKRLILAQLPLRVPAGVQVEPYPIPPLRRTGYGRTYFVVESWPEINMNEARFPSLHVVLKGEADFRFGAVGGSAGPGTPPQRTSEGPRGRTPRGSTICLMSALSAGTVLAIPAGVLQDTGQAHWFRPHPERANSDLFSMKFIPEGIVCHMCSTAGLKHLRGGWLLARDTRALALAEFLIEELRARQLHSMDLAQHYLSALMLSVHRSLTSPSGVVTGNELRLFLKEEEVKVEVGNASLAPETVFNRACSYIQAHLHEEITLDEIAVHACVSPRTLIRIFNSRANVPVMRFVLQRRMESAHFYLQHSGLPIAEIGRLVGYARPNEFSRAFSRHTGSPPSALRGKRENEV